MMKSPSKNILLCLAALLWTAQVFSVGLGSSMKLDSEVSEKMVAEVNPSEVLCGADAGFDGLPYIGYVDADEEAEHIVCKYPHQKDEQKGRRRTTRDSFWVLNISGVGFLSWLYDNAAIQVEKGTGTEFFKFTYQQLTEGMEGKAAVNAQDTNTPNVASTESLTSLCAVHNNASFSLDFGYVFPADAGGEKCVLSAKVKYSTAGSRTDVVGKYVETKAKGWCYKVYANGFCKVKKDHSNIAAQACEEEAREQGVGYCRDTSGACCFLNDRRKLNRADDDDGKNTCYLPEGLNERSVYARCGVTNAFISAGEKISDSLADFDDSVHDLFD